MNVLGDFYGSGFLIRLIHESAQLHLAFKGVNNDIGEFVIWILA